MRYTKSLSLLTLALIVGYSNSYSQSSLNLGIGTVSVFPKNPQSGLHYYYGVRVTLDQTYNEDVTVKGYIFDNNSPSIIQSYAVTVSSGNLSNETADTFFDTSPITVVGVSITHAAPIYVTKNDSIYVVNGPPGVFTEDFVALTKAFHDSLQLAYDYLDGLITLNQQRLDDFIAAFCDSSIAYVASEFSLDVKDVELFAHKFDTAYSIFDSMGKYQYGPVDSISPSQLISLWYLESNALVYSRLAPEEVGNGPVECIVGFTLCMTIAYGSHGAELVHCNIYYIFNGSMRKKCIAASNENFQYANQGCITSLAACMGSQ